MRELDEEVKVWKDYAKTIDDWQKLVEGITPKDTDCGPVYEIPGLLGRKNESFAIADMRDIKVALPHYHTGGETEIYIVIEGSGLSVVGGEEKRIKNGDIVITPPQTAHFTIPNDNLVMVVINTPPFDPKNNVPVTESDPDVGFNKNQYERLAK